MADWKLETTDHDIDTALERLHNEPEEPTLAKVEYMRDRELLLLTVSDGRRVALPREDIWAVHKATQDQVANFVIQPDQRGIWWPDVDEGIYLLNTLEGRTGPPWWMDKVHRRESVEAA